MSGGVICFILLTFTFLFYVITCFCSWKIFINNLLFMILRSLHRLTLILYFVLFIDLQLPLVIFFTVGLAADWQGYVIFNRDNNSHLGAYQFVSYLLLNFRALFIFNILFIMRCACVYFMLLVHQSFDCVGLIQYIYVHV